MSHVPMLKATLVARQIDAEDVLESLQEAGVFHVGEVTVPEAMAKTLAPDVILDDDDRQVIAVYEKLERLAHAINSVAPAPASKQETELGYAAVIERVQSILDERTAVDERLVALRSREVLLAPWGAHHAADVDALRHHGVHLTFVRMARAEWDVAAAKVKTPRVVVKSDANEVYAVFVHKDGDDAPPFSSAELPRTNLDELRKEIAALESKRLSLARELGRFAHFAETMRARMASLNDRVELVRARMKGLHHATLFALSGYVPVDQALHLQEVVKPFDVALELRDPTDDDERVPVKLKNNFLVSGFESVVKAFSGVSHREKDFTWAVGLLFIVFGSLCLLDGGYGVLLFITGLVLRAKGVKGFGNVFAITGLVSAGVGLLVGQFFGMVVGTHIFEGYKPLLTLAEKPYDAFMFSLVVGMFAILFSHGVAVWQRGFKTQATGNLLLVVAAMAAVFANLAGTYVLTVVGGFETPDATSLAAAKEWGNRVAMLVGALSLGALITFPDPVFGKDARAGNVLWTLYSSPTGFLQDLLSHMRLFGISLSGSIMALVVNDIGGRFPLPVTVVFAVVAHIFVFVLSLLSLYIHTNRLIFLEFGSKCIDGGHQHFSPLRRSAAS